MSKSLRGFHHLSLVEQTAETLAEAISTGEMPDFLPGEMELSARLRVSRPTLRRALLILVRQGLVVTAKGKRTRVVKRKNRRSACPEASVCFLAPVSPRSAILFNALLDEVKFALTAEGVQWDAVYEPQLGGRNPEARLRDILAGRKRTCYVLLNSSRLLQQWFSKCGEPVLVMGSCYKGIDLPSVDLDYYAVGWHAGGQFIKNGHKRIVFVEPREAAVGLEASEAGLRKYLAGIEGARVQVLQTDASGFAAAWERSLRGPDAPTAALACRSEMALSVLGVAQQFGRCIPRDFSLIARDDHQVFEFIAPQISRYRCNLHAIARKTVRLIHPLLQGAVPSQKTTLVVPDFFAGETLRPR